MYKNILIATDGSALAEGALQHGLLLAKEHKSNTTIITVTEIWTATDIAARTEYGETDAIQHFEEFQTSLAEKVLAKAESKANDMGVICETVHIKDKFPADGIIEFANLQNADLIVMASHGRRGIKRAFLGSVTNEVISRASVPVLIYQ